MAFKGDDSTLSLTTTVTLALAVAAMVLVKTPLQSSRPPGSGTGLHEAAGELKVRARLWEDPFAAVERALEAQRQITLQVVANEQRLGVVTALVGQELHSGDGLESLRSRISEANNDLILALVVMTQGGSSVEATEVRIRDRYAVAAALEVSCFAPDKGESLSYFKWDFPKSVQAESAGASRRVKTPLDSETGSHSTRQYTPYEWYSRNAIGTCPPPDNSPDSPSQVLVLWVKAQEDEDRILARLSELVSKFPQVSAKLVGPRTSSEFRRILEELSKRNPREGYSWQFPVRLNHWGVAQPLTRDKKIQLYSPWATAMPGLLSYSYRHSGVNGGMDCRRYAACENMFRELLISGGLIPAYTVTSDHVLFASLLDELERRKVEVGKDRIVLIGEWDSFYARALPVTFTAAACHHATTKTKESLINPCPDIQTAIDNLLRGALSPKDLNISQYSYLSGLDGETAEDHAKRTKSKDEDKAKERDNAEGKGPFRDIASYERPEGKAQLDYVRRLVARIKSETREGNSADDRTTKARRGRVKAIGILGRDPYDALLILQAVREEFPNALFFATDLDARYFHEDEQKWTRNLIVASQFGLQLEPSLQRSIPPFRSSLQTSTFFAVLQAIGAVAATPQNETIPPRLFEIGRHGAVDLSPDRPETRLNTVHPARIDVDEIGGFNPPPYLVPLWIVGLTLGFLALWGYGRLWNWMTARDEPDPAMRRLQWIPRFSWVAIPLVLVLVVACWIAHFDTYAEEEPFSWTDGVSIWPTEALRFMAMCLSLFFLFKARADSARNFDELTKSFSPDLPSDPTPGGWRDKLKGFWSDLNWMFHGSKQDYPGDLKDLWMRYRRAHGFLPRAARIAMGFVAYLCLILPMVLVMNGGEFRLSVPCRGEFSCALDAKLLSVSVLSFLLLNLSLLDAVILCTKWIQEMPAATSKLTSMQKIRLIVERSMVVNRRVLPPFLVLFLLIAARNHYFDNWDFPPGLILALTVNSLVLITSATLLYVAAVQAKRRILASVQEQLDRVMAHIEERGLAPIKVAAGSSSDRLRQIITDIDGIQQGAFVPFYQQPMVQATLVAALAFLQYWYLGQ
ncbi:MAG: hypothetical protein H8K09_08515 [Nitrospira sp.]|nr:hypothetical protein [Nitrospira sp.]